MSLSRHVNPEDLIQHLHDVRIAEVMPEARSRAASSHLTPYSSRYASQTNIPKYKIPAEGAPGDTVYAMLKDELDLDGRPNLNLASFVDTYLEDNANKLMVENMAKNLADNDEYPSLLAISQRCVSMLAHLWGVRPGEKALGSPTVGSSEAVHLGGLAMKRRWQERRRARGQDTLRPNIIMGANAQVALEKFARYFEVEARILPVSAASQYRLDPELVRRNIDENTIGVFVILGSTYTGHYEPVEEISKILDEFQEETGIDIPIHLDAASGGFIAPFTHVQAGGPKWNFELPRVVSINASGHKYGLVYPGIGWIVWRDESYLPKDLIFELHYLGGTEESYTLNFSRPGAQVIVQYYNLIHLGFAGYREIMENCLANARLLSKSLEATGWYICLSDIHRPAKTTGAGIAQAVRPAVTSAIASTLGGSSDSGKKDGDGRFSNKEDPLATSAGYQPGLPAVAFRFTDDFRRAYPYARQETVSLLLRARQWIVPNYALPPGENATEILRVVVRETMSFDMLERLVADIVEVTEKLMAGGEDIDLTILQNRRAAGPRKKNRKEEGEGGREEKAAGGTGEKKTGSLDEKKEQGKNSKEAWKDVKRMAEGIHRSTC